MVVLRLGGVYADIDTECRQPLNGLLRARDTLVVSWENEFESAEEANRRKYVRKRQVLQWVFAGAPGHPALREICDHIARNARATYSDNTNVDTLEKTGPGIWTDVVLKHARLHPPANVRTPLQVLMPGLTGRTQAWNCWVHTQLWLCEFRGWKGGL
jgi:mannosyltransferase OCH1-like enzyme